MCPWVRIDENIIDHPKFIALTPLAFWLWVEGLTYCQKHLTDGHIPGPVVRGMRHYSPASMRRLTSALVTGKSPLWHEEVNGDVLVHDYLEHNDSRVYVLSKRAAARERMGRKRSREHPSEHLTSDSANTYRGGTGKELRVIPEEGEGGVGETHLKARAGVFCEWYAAKHYELFDVGYFGSNADYQKAIELCKRFSDSDLQEAALVWFGQRDKFATDGTRTIPKFASRATGCLQTARRTAS
jgi:hypothetical protein